MLSCCDEPRTRLWVSYLHTIADVDGKPILVLPGRKVEVVACAFDADERAFYDALEQKSALTFNKVSSQVTALIQFLSSGTVMANYTSVLTMLLRLRQGESYFAMC